FRRRAMASLPPLRTGRICPNAFSNQLDKWNDLSGCPARRGELRALVIDRGLQPSFIQVHALKFWRGLMFGDEGTEPQTGLAMSGGGFRATLFHLGALVRLNEFGFLPKLDRISSVSGGSITNGLLAVRWHQLKFDAATGVAANFGPLIVE